MTSFRLWIQKNSLLISTPRVASLFLDLVFYENKKGRNYFSINNNLEIEISKDPTIDDIDYEKNLNSILNTDIRKDILFIYRHPREKIILGVVEDFNEILTNDIYSNNFLIEYFFNFDSSYNEFYFLDKSTTIDLIKNINEESNKKFKDYYLSLLRLFFEFNITFSFNSAHFSNSLSILYPFINEKIENKNNLKILDIDSAGYNPLFEFLKDYKTIDKNIECINHNNHIIKLVNSYILQQNSSLNNQLNKIIENELFFYNILKNSKYNI